MVNGISISEKEFMDMPAPQRDCILFQNQLRQMENQNLIFQKIEGYKFYQKLSAWIGGILIAGMGILFKLQFK